MKSFLFLVTIAACNFCISCNSGGMSATAKKNIEVNDAIMKAYEAGDFSKMGDYIAADAVDHGSDHGDVKGLDSIVADMKRYHAMMPDMKQVITRTVADDEYVFTWSKMSGTMGGKQIDMTGVDVTKFKDGKAVEHWLYSDPNEMMKMMQAMTPPAAADTMKMGTKPAPDSTGKK